MTMMTITHIVHESDVAWLLVWNHENYGCWNPHDASNTAPSAAAVDRIARAFFASHGNSADEAVPAGADEDVWSAARELAAKWARRFDRS